MSGILEYAWVFVVLVGLEGILAADNALVMAMMVKHLPERLQKKALLYGLGGAFIFRFASLFVISFIVNIWQVQALGAAYLLYIAVKNLWDRSRNDQNKQNESESNGSGFWPTVLKVELSDIAFAIDSILAAVALAATLSNTGLPAIGGMDGGKFLVVLLAGMTGVVFIRFAAHKFIKLLEQRPGLEAAAYIIIAWVSIKLIVQVLAHPNVHLISKHFPESIIWKMIFWSVLVLIAAAGWFMAEKKETAS
ncbi:TerC family protein [Halobacillus salinarum]|uniref:TerC family protein n=1 Tax=Halobacillus salinarum TaxID=2932257 RepID=A0ABY4EFM4_9BACI|nr:TerC family protein [Halobacillus salinarum]UOQ42785.1 TerC family protein [Halobacillus salinarum]